MPTPVIFAGTGIDPVAVASADSHEPTTVSRVYYATDRTPRSNPKDAASIYTNDRSYGLRLGVASVDLAPKMDWQTLHTESLRAKRSRNPKPILTGVDEIGALWAAIPPLNAEAVEDETVARQFAEQVQADLDNSNTNEIYIYIHGFNTRFNSNAVTAAQMHHYLGSQGVFMSYAWPSQGSLFSYGADKASAQYSIRYFRLFLMYLASQTDVSRINIIAHSAGAPIAVGAIRELCLMHFDEDADAVQERYRLGQLVLVAPDMDLGVFMNAIHDEFVGVPENMTIYFSTRDKALDISARIFGFARLGEPLEAFTKEDIEFFHDHPDITLIDVAGAEKDHGSWLGHSYFHSDPWVSSDVIMLMRHHTNPASRGLVMHKSDPIWVFPKDYPERARAAAKTIYNTTH